MTNKFYLNGKVVKMTIFIDQNGHFSCLPCITYSLNALSVTYASIRQTYFSDAKQFVFLFCARNIRRTNPLCHQVLDQVVVEPVVDEVGVVVHQILQPVKLSQTQKNRSQTQRFQRLWAHQQNASRKNWQKLHWTHHQIAPLAPKETTCMSGCRQFQGHLDPFTKEESFSLTFTSRPNTLSNHLR